MERKYSFENLEVWKDARNFVVDVYTLTKTMPEHEKYGLCSQIQRASVSIASNIAEGTSRTTDKEKIRFIEIAYGSLMEVYCQFYLALDLEYITKEQFESQKSAVDKVAIKLSALKNAYKKRLND
ncbi:four helix bundle protein [Microbacter margulisiae]|uniref:Four helix bundle protein n=1 Tax=Microbacter margulisiae TaxID=1350067 RepID=A0A7W5H3H8_9PORP|nr:four helix bundle protein [Microbacter margulisiae]MBB3188402.1 four helix bundle protein [Microbacter margulisiae]